MGLFTGVAVLIAALTLASPAAAQDAASAFARLLATHVRPATIAGIRLAAVDYGALKADPDYARAVAHLAEARIETLRNDAEAIAFWLNAYNLLAIKAVVDRYPVASIRDGGSFLQSIWKKKVGIVGGREYALDDIEHSILRARFREPRIHMAIVCASLSCPDLKTEPYVADRLSTQLDDATRRFLANPRRACAAAPTAAPRRSRRSSGGSLRTSEGPTASSGSSEHTPPASWAGA